MCMHHTSDLDALAHLLWYHSQKHRCELHQRHSIAPLRALFIEPNCMKPPRNFELGCKFYRLGVRCGFAGDKLQCDLCQGYTLDVEPSSDCDLGPGESLSGQDGAIGPSLLGPTYLAAQVSAVSKLWQVTISAPDWNVP